MSWSNASEFKETAESFDTVAIYNIGLHESLKEEWDNRIDKTAVKLTFDQNHMCKSMNIDLPFLPFSTKEENIAFAECALRNDFPMDDPEAAAIEWCKLVDGVNIFPKLPVHIRIHKESFQRNQRVKDCVEMARSGRPKLTELNNALRPVVAANSEPAKYPEAMPIINQNAIHNLPYVVAGGTAVGTLPIPINKQLVGIGERGKDRKQRAPRRCRRCLKNNGDYALECIGRGGQEK